MRSRRFRRRSDPSWAIRDFLVGVYRYTLRVEAYVGLLTDVYPPFQLTT